MKQEYESEFYDAEGGVGEDFDVETFLRSAERRDRKMRMLAARRKIERRIERRELSRDLGEYYDD
ncbi:MAG: hypothetical protein HKN59_06100 [Gammaproteobacteria bacterium]|nr:hypothetical protein [Gammaproteobacteria bacterium]